MSFLLSLGGNQGPSPVSSWNFQGNTQRVQATGTISSTPAAPYFCTLVPWLHVCQVQQENWGFLHCGALSHCYFCLSNSKLIAVHLAPQRISQEAILGPGLTVGTCVPSFSVPHTLRLTCLHGIPSFLFHSAVSDSERAQATLMTTALARLSRHQISLKFLAAPAWSRHSPLLHLPEQSLTIWPGQDFVK